MIRNCNFTNTDFSRIDLTDDDCFNFEHFYTFVKKRGYVLYPGKLTNENTFRIGNIGEIYEADIEELCNIIESYMGVVKK